ncbi:PREDICTED: uncharacterized protein LOC104610912 isoform X2 [Nelumbo nucifera]|uniref:Uncharacterized protein LOC104610912 isoform X2 n=1 Tax=Nelumbo nucifera TaxID=4432 RepID=A0A1U8B8U9_NELNU|nr:PREDICTED: uncharacterized protein LOC104610912 isoform X2 [Nelumbo nucifera]
MGYKTRDLSDEGIVSPSLSDALLFTTMCIVGLPVEVQVKDGSTYSGIFHTACVEKEYAIVLKRARMIKKGKNDANLTKGAIVDTLVVLSGDLVQVVAKGVALRVDGTFDSVADDEVEAVAGSVSHIERSESEAKVVATDAKQINQIRSLDQDENKSSYDLTNTTSEDGLLMKVEEGTLMNKAAAESFGSGQGVENGKNNNMMLTKTEEAFSVPVDMGQVGKDKSQGKKSGYDQEHGAHKEGNIHEVQSSSTIKVCDMQVKSVDGKNIVVSSSILPNGTSYGCPEPPLAKTEVQGSERSTSIHFPQSDVSTSSTLVVDGSSQSGPSSSTSTVVVPPRSLVSNTGAKEFKLNPGAKTFSPSFAIPRSATPPMVPAIANMAYIPNSSPVVPVACPQPEIEISPFAPRSSLPVKLVQYNPVAGNGSSGSQYSQPVVGHVGGRPQAIRYGGQLHPVQAGPAYVHPNSQAVMVGRFGQLVYVHPVSHDVVQSAAALSQVPARPLLAPHQTHLPKHQGSAAGQALQLCVAPPFVAAAAGQQPFAVQSHIPFSQPPFPAIRPIPVSGPNGFFSSKFP